MKILISAFRYRKIMIENKDEGFINSTSFEIVDALDINKIRNDFNLKKEKKIVLASFFLDIINLDIIFL